LRAIEYVSKVSADGKIQLPARILEELKLKDEGLVKVIVMVEDEDEEDRLWASNQEFIDEMLKARAEDLKGEGMSLKDFEKELISKR